jgi:hypothetical protein
MLISKIFSGGMSTMPCVSHGTNMYSFARQNIFKSHPPPPNFRHLTSLTADSAPAAAFVTIPCAQIGLADYSGGRFEETSGQCYCLLSQITRADR